MRLVGARLLPAGNVHHAGSLLRARIAIAGFRPAAGRRAAIAAALPELDPAWAERPLAEPGDVAAAVADLASAVLRRAGEVGTHRRLVTPVGKDPAVVVVAAADGRVGGAAMHAAIGMMTAVDDADVATVLATFARDVETAMPFLDDVLIVGLATALHVRCRLSASGKREMLLGEGARSRRTLSSLTDRTGFIATEICANKRDTHRALDLAGFPTSPQRSAASAAEARAVAARIGYPVVVKPARASRGIGVACNLTTAHEVASAFRAARRYGNVVVERFIDGDDHRMLVIGGRLMSCARRRGARVVGDGRSTVDRLVAIENARPERQPGPERRMVAIAQDAETDRILALQSLDRSSVAAPGQVVHLRSTSNWSQGGRADSMMDRVHPENVRMAEAVARHLGMDLVGVDMITTDIARPLRETGGVINEVQRQPAVGPQLAALGEATSRLYELVLAHLFPDSAGHRIPIIVAAGGDADAIAERIADRLAAVTVGLATGRGLRIAGRWLSRADHRGSVGIGTLLDDPTVDIAVLSVDPERLLRRGLGHDRIDVAAIAGGLPEEALALISRLASSVVSTRSAGVRDVPGGVARWHVVDGDDDALVALCTGLANAGPTG